MVTYIAMVKIMELTFPSVILMFKVSNKKHQNLVKNTFKDNNKDNRTPFMWFFLMTMFRCIYFLSFNFRHVPYLVLIFLLLSLTWKSPQKTCYALKNMENHINFSSLELTSSYANEIDKMQGNGHLEISVWAQRYWHRHRNRHVNITIVF